MLKGIMRPGHIQIRVMDLDLAVDHYTNALGLILTHRTDDHAFLKGWSEVDAYSVILRQADQAGMDFLGFKVVDHSRLMALSRDVQAFGCPVELLPAEDLPDCGERVRFTIPTGQKIELYCEKLQTGKWGIDAINPQAWPEGLRGMQAERFDHCLFYGPEIDETERLFLDVLGFTLSEQLVDGPVRLASFMSCSMKAHDIAFIRNEAHGALHHVSFHTDAWSDILRAADIVTHRNIPLDVAPTRHGLTHGQTIYFFDPSGNRNEIFAGGNYTYPDHKPVTWTLEQMGKAIFYHDQQPSQRFLTAVT